MRQSDIVLNHLVLAEKSAVRSPRHRPLSHDVQGAFGLTEPAHGVVDAPATEALLRQQEPPTSGSDQMITGHATILEHHLGVVAPPANTQMGWAIVGISAQDLHAGRTRRHNKDRGVPVGGPAGSVSATTRTMSAHEALVVNHLCPLMTQESPSSTAVVSITVGSASQKRLGQREGTGNLPAQVRKRPPLLLSFIGPMSKQLHVAAIGCLYAEQLHRDHAPADDL